MATNKYGAATDRQLAYIRKLISSGNLSPELVDQAKYNLSSPGLTRVMASGLISFLQSASNTGDRK